MCKEEEQVTGNEQDSSKPAVDPALIVQGTRDGKPEVDTRLVVNLKASEPPDPDAIRFVEVTTPESGSSDGEKE